MREIAAGTFVTPLQQQPGPAAVPVGEGLQVGCEAARTPCPQAPSDGPATHGRSLLVTIFSLECGIGTEAPLFPNAAPSGYSEWHFPFLVPGPRFSLMSRPMENGIPLLPTLWGFRPPRTRNSAQSSGLQPALPLQPRGLLLSLK